MKLPITHVFTEAIVWKKFSREELRSIARHHNIPRGRNKLDTIENLLKANKLVVTVNVKVIWENI